MGGSECKYSTSGGQLCAAPREVGGTNDVTVSNRVNLVDPFLDAQEAKKVSERTVD